MDKIESAIEITKAVIGNNKYMKLYEDDMINCINLSPEAINEITYDAVEIVNRIYKKLGL